MTDYDPLSTHTPELVKDDRPVVEHAETRDATPTAQPPAKTEQAHPGKRTRVSSLWIATAASALLLIGLLIFILENLKQVRVSFLGWDGHLPLGVALLFAAITGALLMAVLAGARVLQLRIAAHRLARRH